MLSIFTVIVGILSGATIFYLRSAMVLAHKQKEASIRLRGYLLYWQGWVIDNDYFKVFYEGIRWNEEIKEILNDGGGAKELVKLKEEKRSLICGIEDAIQNNKIEFDQKSMRECVCKMSPDTVEMFLDSVKKSKQNLIDGKTFVTDEESSILGASVMQHSIELKMHLISAIDAAIIIFLCALNNPEGFEVKNHAKDISKAIWKAVVISKNIDSLLKIAEKVSSQSILDLTIYNVFKGI